MWVSGLGVKSILILSTLSSLYLVVAFFCRLLLLFYLIRSFVPEFIVSSLSSVCLLLFCLQFDYHEACVQYLRVYFESLTDKLICT